MRRIWRRKERRRGFRGQRKAAVARVFFRRAVVVAVPERRHRNDDERCKRKQADGEDAAGPLAFRIADAEPERSPQAAASHKTLRWSRKLTGERQQSGGEKRC